MTERFQFNDTDYLCFRDLIEERTGMMIGNNRRDTLARSLKESIQHTGCKDLSAYLSCLKASQTDSAFWDDLVKRLTIGETYFFRHSEQIESLRKNILSDLIARHWTDRTLNLWSAGCATGEEPYTLAILLRQLLPDIERWRIQILATDINRKALAHAAAGHYRDWSFRDTDPAVSRNYFTHEADRFILDSSIREMVTFSYLNLSEDTYPSPVNNTSRLDLILCRNVTIYLPRHVIRQIAERFYQCLTPGGWLMVGPSETNLEVYNKFQMLIFYGSMVYQKLGAAPASSDLQKTDSERVKGKLLSRPIDPKPLIPPVSRIVPALLSDTILAPTLKNAAKDRTFVKPISAAGISVVVPGIQKKAPPSQSEDNFLEQGETFMKQRLYAKARECFLAHLAEEPSSVSARYWMACNESNAGRLDEALKWAEQAIEGDPLRSEAHYALALIHQAQGKTDAAVNCLKKAIYLDQDFILAHFSLFHVYEGIGRKNDAERHRALAVRLASRLSPDTVLPGSDDLTAEQLLNMARVGIQLPDSASGGKV